MLDNDNDKDSTADTRICFETRAAGNRRVRDFHQSNGVEAKARNTGIAAANESFFAQLESDPLRRSWKIELHASWMEAFPVVAMGGPDIAAFVSSERVFHRAYIRMMDSLSKARVASSLFPQWWYLRQTAQSMQAVVQDASSLTWAIFSPMIMATLVHSASVLLRHESVVRVAVFNEPLCCAGGDYDFHRRTCCNGAVGLSELAAMRYRRGLPYRLARDEYRRHRATYFLHAVQPIRALTRLRITRRQRMARSRAGRQLPLD